MMMRSLRNFLTSLTSPRQQQKPHVVLVLGGAQSGKTALVYRLAALDAWTGAMPWRVDRLGARHERMRSSTLW